jgi:acyl-CoA reductase-like NAD-dependent aldehyde dehydrogenase
MDSAERFTVPFIIDGQDFISDQTFDVTSPETGKSVWSSCAATTSDAIKAVESCQNAFSSWSQTAPPFRRDIFLRAADILERRATELAEYMMIETGSHAFWAEQFNLPLAAEIIRDMAGRSNQLGGEIPLLDNSNTSALVWREPYGVILGIAPW